jgi:hypothetical protein
MTIAQLLQAVVNHPYPISTRIVVPKDVPIYMDVSIHDALPIIDTKVVDVREYAQIALKSYNKEIEGLYQTLVLIQQAFEDYKRGHEEYQEFLRFKKGGR